jgi:hypothetical protein
MQVKLVCNDLVALARSRPDRFSGNQLSGVRECPLEGRFPASEAGQKLPFGAGHLIALKSSECRIQLSGRTEERHSRRVANFCVFTQPGSQVALVRLLTLVAHLPEAHNAALRAKVSNGPTAGPDHPEERTSSGSIGMSLNVPIANFTRLPRLSQAAHPTSR